MSIEGRPDEPRRSRPSTPRSTPASPSSTPPTPTTCDADEVGHNEELIAEALRSYGGDTSDVLVATKGGHLRPGDGSWTQDGRPEYLKEAAKASASASASTRSGSTSSTGPTRTCPTPTRSARSATCSTRASSRWPASRTRTPTRSRGATTILGGRLVSVQNQFSPALPLGLEPELEHCAALGIAFLPWRPLGGIRRARASSAGSTPRSSEVADDARRQPAAGRARMGARARARRHPDPRRLAARRASGLRARPPNSSSPPTRSRGSRRASSRPDPLTRSQEHP